MASNMSSTAPAMKKQVAIGDQLCSGSSNYLVQSFLGQGAFGTVAKCTRMTDMKTVAIKMMKKEGSLIFQARAEVAALTKLRSLDPDKCNIVRWYQVFTSRDHFCLEFEALDKSLYDLMKERLFQPFLLMEIRPIVQQIATALDHLKSAGMMHADLKVENIMLVNHEREPYRVKVIDFGLACDVSAAKVGWYIQTRPYRAPEILLGLPFTEAIDMWSLGCMAAGLYLGDLLYPGRSEYDMIRYIVETQGLPPDHLLNHGRKTRSFFQIDSRMNLWNLKTPQQYCAETGIQSMETRGMKFSSLYDLLHIWKIKSQGPADKFDELSDQLCFLDMLCGMLELDATKRITPRQVLEHQFTSMCSMLNKNPISSYAQSCMELMDVCQKKTPTSDSGPAQQELPPPADPLPCTRPHTPCSVKSGTKRKADDEDGPQVEPRVDRKRFRKSPEGPSTSSCSSQTKSPGSRRLKRKRSQDEDCNEESDHERKRDRKSPAGPSTCSSSNTPHVAVPSEHQHTTQTSISSLKRKAADDDEPLISCHIKRRRCLSCGKRLRGAGETTQNMRAPEADISQRAGKL